MKISVNELKIIIESLPAAQEHPENEIRHELAYYEDDGLKHETRSAKFLFSKNRFKDGWDIKFADYAFPLLWA